MTKTKDELLALAAYLDEDAELLDKHGAIGDGNNSREAAALIRSGCQKVSPACDGCYAERDAKRFAPGRALWGAGSERRIFDIETDAGAKHWKAPLQWAKTMPKKLGRRPRVFCASMGDWLDLVAPIGEFVRLLDTIRRTPELDWLLLSKRIGNWRKRILAAISFKEGISQELAGWLGDWYEGNAPANVWLGATVINQAEADRDIPKLLAVPARVRFLSIEPMLGAIDLEQACDIAEERVCAQRTWDTMADPQRCLAALRHGSVRMLDWVIAGGESGPGARPMHPDWARSLRDQCTAAGVPFHFKQWGEWVPCETESSTDFAGREVYADDGCGVDLPDGRRLRVVEAHGREFVHVGTKAAGRLLDGVEHNGFPEAA